MKIFLLSVALLSLSVISIAQRNSDTLGKTPKAPYDLVDIQDNVSLVRLIANPEKYDGKRIQVIGYLHLEFEGDAIYLHQEDFKNSIYENSFWVNFSRELAKKIDLKKFSNKYVILTGTFKADEKGHMGMFGGTLDNVMRLDIWK